MTNPTTNNPLAGYFRGSDVHQMLPTQGRYFAEGDIDLSITGEVAVLPMTAADEIVLKNPDALLNGDALERLFKSCVPAIHKVRDISVPDMDVLLLAIKLASNGDELDVTVKCQKCQHEFTYQLSIRTILANIKMLEERDTVVRLSDELVVHLRPYDFLAKTKLDLASFEEQKLLQYLLSLEASDEDKAKIFNESFEKYALLNLDLLSHCIRSVSTPSGDVTDEQFIREFIRNSAKQVTHKVREQLKVISESGIDRRVEAPCPKEGCGNICETEMSFDPSTFFA